MAEEEEDDDGDEEDHDDDDEDEDSDEDDEDEVAREADEGAGFRIPNLRVQQFIPRLSQHWLLVWTCLLQLKVEAVRVETADVRVSILIRGCACSVDG